MLLPNPSPFLEQFLLTKLSQREVKDWLQTYARPYRELMSCYRCAMMEIETKFNVLNEELSLQYDRNPIETIKTRLKSPESILEKLQRKGLPLTVESIEKNLSDIAGVRVICSYLDDVYTIAQALTKQDDVRLLRIKDYIKEPKENGYRSLHLIVSIPVFFAEMPRDVKVEVQIRTVAMDYWAELEHQLRYKQEIPNEAEIVRDLTDCAKKTAEIDAQMLAIRKKIENGTEKPTEDELLIEKLKRIDFSME